MKRIAIVAAVLVTIIVVAALTLRNGEETVARFTPRPEQRKNPWFFRANPLLSKLRMPRT